MPTVMNIFCQNGDKVTNIRLLITALSALKVISKKVRIMTVKNAASPNCHPISAQIIRVDEKANQYIRINFFRSITSRIHELSRLA
jgi:hypothetical protein